MRYINIKTSDKFILKYFPILDEEYKVLIYFISKNKNEVVDLMIDTYYLDKEYNEISPFDKEKDLPF